MKIEDKRFLINRLVFTKFHYINGIVSILIGITNKLVTISTKLLLEGSILLYFDKRQHRRKICVLMEQ